MPALKCAGYARHCKPAFDHARHACHSTWAYSWKNPRLTICTKPQFVSQNIFNPSWMLMSPLTASVLASATHFHDCLQRRQVAGLHLPVQVVRVHMVRDGHLPVAQRFEQAGLAAPIGANQAIPPAGAARGEGAGRTIRGASQEPPACMLKGCKAAQSSPWLHFHQGSVR